MTIWTPKLPDGNQNKYEAIANALGEDIASGNLKPGEKLPTQRDLAKRLAVTIGTVGRAYALAEKRGWISPEVGRGSFVRIFQLSADGNGDSSVIDLGLNLPPATRHPDLYAQTLSQISRSTSIRTLFGSSPVESFLRHRCAAAKWLSDRIPCSSDDVLICSGTQNALVATLATVTRPGDSVLVEELTFPGMIAAAKLLHLKLVPVAMDNEGIVPAELARAAKKAGVLYCVPTNQNPTTATMSLNRRQEIVRVSAQKKLLVIEDDVYGKLVENAPAPIASLLPDQSILICSLAKTMSVGLRIAFVRVPVTHRELMITNLRASNFFPPPLMSEIATNWIDDGTANRLLLELRETARRRQQIAREVFGQLIAGSEPVGNHIWINLPKNWTAEMLARAASENGVSLYTADTFAVDESRKHNAVRLALGSARDEAELRGGLNVVARLLADEAEQISVKY